MMPIEKEKWDELLMKDKWERKNNVKENMLTSVCRVSYICLEKSNVPYQNSTSPSKFCFTTVLNYLFIWIQNANIL